MVLAQPASKTIGIAYIMHWTGRSQWTVYHWVRTGFLPPPKEKRPMRWPKDQIDQWLNDNFDFH